MNMRDEFENAATNAGLSVRRCMDGDYFDQNTRMAYEVWQAAREQGGGDTEGYPDCDTCGGSMDYMPWHYATETERHLHACDECWPKVNPAQL